MNLTTATTSTILPCSSYLSAQSTLLENGQNGLNDVWGHPNIASWQTYFGQSPECRSYAKALSQGQYTYSNCGSSNTVIQSSSGVDFADSLQVPPIFRYFSPEYTGSCCGNCSLDIPEVRLYYFPDKTIIDCHNNQTFNFTSVVSARNLEKRVHSLIANGSTAIFEGHTLYVKHSQFQRYS